VSPPVRYLWILRHAKAASDAPWGGSDKDRPLTARGRRDASALGKRLAADPVDLPFGHDLGTGGDSSGPGPALGPDSGPVGLPRPELAVCSAAVRTRQTTDLVVEAMGGEVPVSAYRSLYEADADLVLQYVREIDEAADSALLVGHNPTMFDVAFRLLAEPPDPADPPDPTDPESGASESTSDQDVLEAHGFPTCALAVLSLQVAAWEDVVHGCGTLVGVAKPPY
jgi:phosphohistidine phosphatase